MPPATAPRSNPVEAQEPYAYGYPADPYYVVLPPAPSLPDRRRRRLRFLAYAVTLVLLLGLLLGGALYYFWPSHPSIQVFPQFNNMNFQTIPNPGSDVPYLFMNISMAMFLRIQNRDYFSVGYDSVDTGLEYRGQTIGVVKSEGGHVPARYTAYVNTTLKLDRIQILHDVVNLLEDLACKKLPLDTVAKFNGRVRVLFAKISLKEVVSCAVVVNPDNQTILSQDCGLG